VGRRGKGWKEENSGKGGSRPIIGKSLRKRTKLGTAFRTKGNEMPPSKRKNRKGSMTHSSTRKKKKEHLADRPWYSGAATVATYFSKKKKKLRGWACRKRLDSSQGGDNQRKFGIKGSTTKRVQKKGGGTGSVAEENALEASAEARQKKLLAEE